MTRFRWGVLALIVAAIAAYLVFGRAAGPSGSGPRAIPVAVTKPVAQDVPIYINAVGNVQANNSVLVRVRVDGEVKRIAFEEGQFVKAGDLLAEIDARALHAALPAPACAAATKLFSRRPMPPISIATLWPARTRGAPAAMPTSSRSPADSVMNSVTSASN